MAHLSTKEREESLRTEEEEKSKKYTRTERLHISLRTASLSRVYCFTSPNHCGLEDNQMKAYSKQSRELKWQY